MALGKLCLTCETLAKRCVPLFVQQLHASPAPAVGCTSQPAPAVDDGPAVVKCAGLCVCELGIVCVAVAGVQFETVFPFACIHCISACGCLSFSSTCRQCLAGGLHSLDELAAHVRSSANSTGDPSVSTCGTPGPPPAAASRDPGSHQDRGDNTFRRAGSEPLIGSYNNVPGVCSRICVGRGRCTMCCRSSNDVQGPFHTRLLVDCVQSCPFMTIFVRCCQD